MRQKSHSTDLSSEDIVKGIRRATRKRYSAEVGRREGRPLFADEAATSNVRIWHTPADLGAAAIPSAIRGSSGRAASGPAQPGAAAMTAQLAFTRVLEEVAEADEHRRRLALDRHRDRIQTWFDELAVSDKELLAECFTVFEFETCVALSAAAGDYRASHAANGK